MTNSLKEIIDKLPDTSGVYLMKDAANRVIYVGKASSLIQRVRSYFHESAFVNAKVSAMVPFIQTIDHIRTRSDLEALIMESSLIKQYRPKYNVIFKDDKSYPLIKLTVQEEYPRIFMTRRIVPDGAKYYGPYVMGSVRKMLRTIYKLYPIRDCTLDMAKTYARPCLKEGMGLCSAPCVRKISQEAYAELVKKVMTFLEGRQLAMAKEFQGKMKEEAAKQRYEEAATYRDLAEMVTLLSHQAEHKVQLARLAKQERQRQFRTQALQQLQRAIGLSKPPERIEAFDISNFSGDQAVGSMVVFQDGEPLKDDYRHFNIKTVKGIDDFAMMAEIVHRRYTRLMQEGWNFPDLILIDGGKGQLSAARQVLKELNTPELAIAALAKREEELFLPDRDEPVRLAKDASALHLLQHVRDEAHRFAITHHRRRIRKRLVESVVAKIPGVGPKRTRTLLKHFGGLERMTQASRESFQAVPGLPTAQAEKIYRYFHA